MHKMSCFLHLHPQIPRTNLGNTRPPGPVSRFHSDELRAAHTPCTIQRSLTAMGASPQHFPRHCFRHPASPSSKLLLMPRLNRKPSKPPYDSAAAIAHLTAADPKLRRLIARAGPFTMRRRRARFALRSPAALHPLPAAPRQGRCRHPRQAPRVCSPRTPSPRSRPTPTPHSRKNSPIPPRSISSMRPTSSFAPPASRITRLFRSATSPPKRSTAPSPTLPRIRRMSDADIVAHLTQVRGIGEWTVQMFLIFRLGRPDVLPTNDYGRPQRLRAHLHRPETHGKGHPRRPSHPRSDGEASQEMASLVLGRELVSLARLRPRQTHNSDRCPMIPGGKAAGYRRRTPLTPQSVPSPAKKEHSDMKAAIVTAPGKIPIYGDFQTPAAGAGEELISVRASALSTLTRSRASGAHYSSANLFPAVPGTDGVGLTQSGPPRLLRPARASLRRPRRALPRRGRALHRSSTRSRRHHRRRHRQPRHVRLGRAGRTRPPWRRRDRPRQRSHRAPPAGWPCNWPNTSAPRASSSPAATPQSSRS